MKSIGSNPSTRKHRTTPDAYLMGGKLYQNISGVIVPQGEAISFDYK